MRPMVSGPAAFQPSGVLQTSPVEGSRVSIQSNGMQNTCGNDGWYPWENSIMYRVDRNQERSGSKCRHSDRSALHDCERQREHL